MLPLPYKILITPLLMPCFDTPLRRRCLLPLPLRYLLLFCRAICLRFDMLMLFRVERERYIERAAR